MLGYSREWPEANGPVRLAEVVEDTVGLLTRQFLSGIALTFNLEPDLPAMRVGRSRLKQILLNLVVNAAESMDGKGNLQIVARRITRVADGWALRPRPAPAHVELLVTDSGLGIAPDVLPRIFEPFFTTKNIGSTRGTGLGLSMVYRMAESDGLDIGVDPALAKAALSASSSRSNKLCPTCTLAPRRCRVNIRITCMDEHTIADILVVEDDPAQIRAYSKGLRGCPINCVPAEASGLPPHSPPAFSGAAPGFPQCAGDNSSAHPAKAR
jgi:hypothetical protein